MITSENNQRNLVSRGQEKKLKLEEIAECIQIVKDWPPQQQKDYFEKYCKKIGAQGKEVPKEIGEDMYRIIETFQTRRWQMLCGLPDIGKYAIMAGTAMYCRRKY